LLFLIFSYSKYFLTAAVFRCSDKSACASPSGQDARNIEERDLPFELVAQLDWEIAVAIEERAGIMASGGCACWRSWENACMPPS
jgi:hypothetical protein